MQCKGITFNIGIAELTIYNMLGAFSQSMIFMIFDGATFMIAYLLTPLLIRAYTVAVYTIYYWVVLGVVEC